MKKEPKETKVDTYYRLIRTDRNLFAVETVTMEDNKIKSIDLDTPAYLPIAFEKMRRKTAQMYFEAVNEENKS